MRIAKAKCLSQEKTVQLEREIMNKFSVSAKQLLPLENTISLTLSGPPGAIDFLGWFPLLQHFGAPTRILDWSDSPWVALYFACCEMDKTCGVIWIADFDKVTTFASSERKKGKTIDLLDFMSTYNTNPRIEAQQGRFSICQNNPLSDHLEILKQLDAVKKIEIPLTVKSHFMNHLASMNITAKTLFPGIDGLGKSMTEYCKLWDPNSIIDQRN